MKEIQKIKPLNIIGFLFYFVAVVIVFSATVTYAWFSSELTNIDGNLNLGSMSATIRLYENYDDSLGEDTYIDGLTDATVADSTGTSIVTYDMIQKPWYSNEYASIYLEVENTGTIDLKSILKVAYDNTNLRTFLSYYYYQVVDITANVNSYTAYSTEREKLSAYNAAFQSTIASNVETYISNVTSNGYCITQALPVVNMGTTEVSGTSFFRLDVALSELPTELLTEYNNLSQEQREITINASVTLKQTNAPDDDNDDSGLSIYVSTADAFILAVNSASNGDNLYLTTNIAISRNITITHRVNIILNGYTLTINGNLAYDIGVTGLITLDVSNSSVLNILHNFIIDTPNATFRILGSGSSAQSIIIGDGGEDTGNFYVNCLRDDTNTSTYGYYQYGVSVMEKINESVNTLATMQVDSNTRVTVGLASTSGPIVAIDNATNIDVYNYGQIESIDFSDMSQSGLSSIQIYIYNANHFATGGAVITLPTWSLGWKSKELQSITNPINTRVINAPGSVTGYSVTGSSVFLDIDIENVDVSGDMVVSLGGDYYRVNVQLDGNGSDTYTIRYLLQEYYYNLNNGATEPEFEAWLTTVKGLELYTYNTAVIKTLDFTFFNSYLTNLESIDFSYSNIANSIIPNSAFYDMVTLESVSFPISELAIGNYAFYGTSLSQLTLSSSITAIGTSAFDVNTSANGLLKIFYESENTSTLLSYIGNLTADKTLLFMSSANIASFKTNYAITDTWYVNSYVKYDFVDEYHTYYRVIDGSTVEIVYYAGDWVDVSIPNTILYDLSTYRIISIANSAYRRAINAAGATAIDLEFADNLETIKNDAFYGAQINNLALNHVENLGKYAFSNTAILTSSARPVGFTGMIAVGERAFANTTIGTTGTTSLLTFETYNVTGGVINNSLDLHGNYTPGTAVFDSASFYGVVLNLNGVASITAAMTNNLSLYGCELYLNNVTTIGDSAFELKFKSYTELYPYNKVFAQEVKTIGRLAFKGMYLDEFTIGIKTLYISQGEVNSQASYGGTTDGMIYSDFRATTLTIDGMLPQIASGKSTFLFGSATAGRIYGDVIIKNTNGLLYDFMFYGSSGTNEVSITNLYLYDITNIGDYAFYYANVGTVYSYSGELLLEDSAATIVGEYAFRYSDVDSFGDLTLVEIGTYAFADSIVAANSITANGIIGAYAFYNSDTTGMTTVSLQGTIGESLFSDAMMHTITSIYVNGTMGVSMFEGASIFDCTTITFENTTIEQNTFNGAVIYSACYIDTLGISNAQTLAFYNLTGSSTTVDLTNCLTIDDSALKQITIQTVRLGNTSFLSTYPSTFIYGTALGGIFTDSSASTITNLYIDGELPTQRLGTYVLGANGANVTVTNVYITEYCTNIPANTFYSEDISGRFSVTNFYIQAEDLTIGNSAFRYTNINNMIYDSPIYGEITLVGDYVFYFATINDFTNFTYYDGVALEDAGVLQDVTSYSFQYTTFGADADLTLFHYAIIIEDYAFDHATFTPTTGGANVSFDFTKVETIGHSIFNGIFTSLGTITVGNQTYYSTHLATYYYGNPLGNQGIFTSSTSLSIDEVVIAGNLPDSNVTEAYQTRALGLSGPTNLTIDTITVEAGVTILSDYAFSGYNTTYRTIIDTLDIYATSLSIGEATFKYSDITYFNIYSSNLDLNTNSFSYSILRNMTYDRASGVGAITFDSTAEYTFQHTTIYSMTGFTDASSGIVAEIAPYAFYNATFGIDCNILWIDYVQYVGARAFMYTTFNKTSSNAFVDIDLSSAITIEEEIFAFIPIQLGSLTLGNSSYSGTYGDSYSYGDGINGVLYAAGRIDTLNIVGNLPSVNTYNMLGNSYTVSTTWAVRFGTVNINSSVTGLPNNAFISTSSSFPVIMDILNINSTNITIGENVFYYAHIGTLNFNNSSLTIGASAFDSTVITTINLIGLTMDFGFSTFADSIITTFNYNGTTSGTISMSGQNTFDGASIGAMNDFTYTDTEEHSIITNISNYAFQNVIFAMDCDVSWIQYVTSIGTYAFSGTTFTKTSLDNFVSLDLTKVLTIGANAFYHLPIGLGTVTVGNSSYIANPSYAYGNGVNGIFNNVGTIQHLIVAGALPATSYYALGNITSNITYLTTYGVVEIAASITSLPKGVFAGTDTVYSTTITTLYIYSTSLTIGEAAFNNTIITNLNIPSATSFNGVGANAFRNSNITNAYVTGTLTLTGSVNDYAFYGFDFTGITLNVQAVSYVGEYAFSYITYTGSLTFTSPIVLIDADYMFASANITGNLTFNSITSLGSNIFNGLVSGTGVTYTFTFVNCLSVTSDYAFGNMNGGGTVYVVINGLPTLNSYRAFYNSTNIITIVFNEDLINLNANNVFENANNLVSLAFNNILYVTLVNSTITTLPSAVKIYVPGILLSEYLMDTYWSLVADQISTTYNIDATSIWGFYILGSTYTVNLCKYLGFATTVTIPATITYSSQTYTVLALDADLFTGTSVTDITVPRGIENVNMDLFSNSNVEDVNFTGTGTEPFYIDTDANGNKLIYDSSQKMVIYKYLKSNTSTSYTIETTVIEIAEKAFYQNSYLQTLNFVAGTVQTSNVNSYETTYPYNLVLAQYAISECSALTTIHLQNNSSGFGVVLNSYSINSNPALTTLELIGFQSFINSYSVYNNDAVTLVSLQPATSYAYGNRGNVYSNISIEPYAFFGSGTDTGTACFYTSMYQNFIFSRAFANSRITLFEFNVNIASPNGYSVDVYNADAFAVGVTIEVNGNGDVIQTYEDITIRVPTALVSNYSALPGFAFYSTSIVGVSTFTHTLP